MTSKKRPSERCTALPFRVQCDRTLTVFNQNRGSAQGAHPAERKH
ncbi:hypothetical protein [Vacuolonema iberomarrocanum]